MYTNLANSKALIHSQFTNDMMKPNQYEGEKSY